jgi:hypothetical protein
VGRVGLLVQHRRHGPSPFLRARRPHCEQGLGSSGRGAGREHGPHRPVSALMNPGRRQRGQVDFAAAASRRSRHSRQRTLVLNRRTWPHSAHEREQRTHSPVPGLRRRKWPQPGQFARRPASRSAARHRWQSASLLKPTPAPQRVQSAVLTKAASSDPVPAWAGLAGPSRVVAWPRPA